MKKIMVVFGTRPEAIKMCPLVLELKKRKKFETVVALTGQHNEMLSQVMEVFNIKEDYNLKVMKKNQSLTDITVNIMKGMEDILKKEKPDLVLVHGDTSTSFVVALTSFYNHIPVGHVEAGLRTYNKYSPYPEEFNRQSISSLSDLHFAPTQKAKENLINEQKDPKSIFVTGNTVIDALKTTIKDDYYNSELDFAKGKKLILLTMHRRENLGEKMMSSFKAIKRVVDENEDIAVLYPIHLNPKVRQIAREVFKDNENIKLIEPVDVFDFHNIMKNSYLILTDSGGIQEEAPAIGKPVLVLRDTTERPEGIKAGTLKLIGTEEDKVYKELTHILSDKEEYEKMTKAQNPYGDGRASIYITDIIEDYFK
ncbi:non-hydrolyzing UDP-N-acetylglucosamine 2-epimerase [Mediannikoviicoccus vaginalis]|uniref:non-hydrolyzing UDP-N-acetylglucosamine 2-epimerase n=1 Tax=Mediannikoviicoccus vaginalis TaxID=2899727 RepID=UPI001F010B1E|nr:UDP-N-acetylglucosamine 2-epimerase (non-hydrolyzing) [Mediannikoviicoccus vaginalis]